MNLSLTGANGSAYWNLIVVQIPTLTNDYSIFIDQRKLILRVAVRGPRLLCGFWTFKFDINSYNYFSNHLSDQHINLFYTCVIRMLVSYHFTNQHISIKKFCKDEVGRINYLSDQRMHSNMINLLDRGSSPQLLNTVINYTAQHYIVDTNTSVS